MDQLAGQNTGVAIRSSFAGGHQNIRIFAGTAQDRDTLPAFWLPVAVCDALKTKLETSTDAALVQAGRCVHEAQAIENESPHRRAGGGGKERRIWRIPARQGASARTGKPALAMASLILHRTLTHPN